MGWGRVPHAGVPEIVTRPHPIRGCGAVFLTRWESVDLAQLSLNGPCFCRLCGYFYLCRSPTPVGDGLQGVFHAHRPQG